MTVRKIKVSARALAGVLPFVPDDSGRFYLQGIHVEPAPQGGVYCIATNGKALGVTYDSAGESNGNWICPIPECVRPYLTSRKVVDYEDDDVTTTKWSRVDPGLAVYFEGGGLYVWSGEPSRPDVISHGLVVAAHEPHIDHTFPNWRPILPKSLDYGAPVNFDPTLIDPFVLGVRAMDSQYRVCLKLAATTHLGPLVVQSSHVREFFGLLMPMRNQSWSSLDWFAGWDFAAMQAAAAHQPPAPTNGAAAGANGQDPNRWPPEPTDGVTGSSHL